MTNPDWNWQVKIGRGRRDTGAHHRTIEVARQLLAICRGLQLTGPGPYHADFNVIVYPAVYALEAGRDYKSVAMSDSFR